MTILKFDRTHFNYDPFPYGVVQGVFAEEVYTEITRNWPDKALFNHKPQWGDKYSLSETENPAAYERIIRDNEIWRTLHAEVKDPAFIGRVLSMLLDANIDLGLMDKWYHGGAGGLNFAKRVKGAVDGFKLKRPQAVPLVTRFEFSMLPAKGGAVLPHTDHHKKHVTMVISVIGESGWDNKIGGGTAFLKPKNSADNFNHVNKMTSFDGFEAFDVVEFEPNQCAIFIKTFNSHHSVQPMVSSDETLFRKTLTLVIAEA